ncbi:Ig-like domain-containing protein [Mycolicibacterium sp. XJ1819]
MIRQVNIPRDTTLFVYNGTFDPNSENTNLITRDDDSGGGPIGLEPQVTANLTAGQTYTIVNSTFGTGGSLNLPLTFTSSGPAIVGGGNAAGGVLDDGETAEDVFDYIVSDGVSSDTGTLRITVTGVNDAPVAVDDVIPGTVSADSTTAVTYNVVANDIDVDGEALNVSAVVNDPPAYGTVGFSGGTVTYIVDTSHATLRGLDTGETITDTFTYTVTDGDLSDTATVTVTIVGVNDAPVANPDAFSVGENSLTGTTYNVVANDTDVDGEALFVSAVINDPPAYGAVSFSGGTVTYVPDATNPTVQGLDTGEILIDTFTYTVSDGNLTDTATVTVTITGVNDAPAVSTSPGTTTYTENGSPVAVDSNLTLSDVDSPTLSGALVALAGAQPGDALAWTPPAGSTITLHPDSTGEFLALTGDASVAEYQEALRNVTFTTAGDAPVAGERTIGFAVFDDQFAPSNGATKTVTVVAANDPPTLSTSAGSTTYTENDAPVPVDPDLVLADPDSPITQAWIGIDGAQPGDVLTWTPLPGNIIHLHPDSSPTFLVLTGTASVDEYLEALRNITFTTAGDAPVAGERTIGFLVFDDHNATATATKTVTVVAVNDVVDGTPDTFTTAPFPGGFNAVAGNVLTNDPLDAEGGVRTVQLVSGPANAVPSTFSLDPATGDFFYIAPESAGEDSFAYRVFDGTEYGASTIVTIAPPLAEPVVLVDQPSATWSTSWCSPCDHADATTFGSFTLDNDATLTSGRFAVLSTQPADDLKITIWDSPGGTILYETDVPSGQYTTEPGGDPPAGYLTYWAVVDLPAWALDAGDYYVSMYSTNASAFGWGSTGGVGDDVVRFNDGSLMFTDRYVGFQLYGHEG